FVFMVEKSSYMFVTGPNVVKTVTHEQVSSEELGGAFTHASKSGVTHFTARNELECLQSIKKLLSYIPQNCEEKPAMVDFDQPDAYREKLNQLIPENPHQPYDMKEVIEEMVDEG